MIPPDITYLLTIGWHVFPVSRTSKHGCYKGALSDASADIKQVFDWSKRFPDCNWRAHPGLSNILCLDIDRAGNLHESDGFATMAELVKRHGDLPDGPRIKTGGSGGCVAIFSLRDQELRGGPGALGPGVDVSTRRGAACPTLPPSIHQRTGGKYLWYPGHAPWEIATPEIPQWICDALKPLPVPEIDMSAITSSGASRLLDLYTSSITNAAAGASNRTIYGQSFKAGRLVSSGVLLYSEAETALHHAALQRVKPEKRGGIMPTIRSGLRGGMGSV